ncbi:MAG: MerR family transcriptional regulator [Gaiellaceae bacterium]
MQLISIGRFSRLTGLGIKALRHYGEIGLLLPAAVDDETGYRFYDASQLVPAEAIRRMRRLELPLEDIGQLLAASDPSTIRDVLVSHQKRLAVRNARLQVALQHLQILIDGKETLMGMRSESLDTDEHRRLGIDLFNKTWTLMEKASRTPSEVDELLHCVHASAYHWLQAGTIANRARSEWQCSRVYTVLGRSEPALHHARRCLELCESAPDEIEEFDLPFAYEAMARAHAFAGDEAESREWLARARAAGEKISDEDDRLLLESDLATIPS